MRRPTLARALRIAAVALGVLSAPAPASAHPMGSSNLELRIGAGSIEALLLAHVDSLPGADRAAALRRFAERCTIVADGEALVARPLRLEISPDGHTARSHFRYALAATPDRLLVRCPPPAGDPEHRTFVDLYEGGTLARQMVLGGETPAAGYSPGSGQSRLEVVRRFVVEGIRHIAIGPDHVLFVIGLLLVPGTIVELLKVVTAFTVAHSITLTLATLGTLSPPAALIEPAIAASVVVVGVQALRGRGAHDPRLLYAFAFGLLHGFGFAYALRETSLPRGALAWSLFSFNVGVEVGQALIVLLVAPGLALLRTRAAPAVARGVVRGGALLVIAAGSFWLLQRLLAPG